MNDIKKDIDLLFNTLKESKTYTEYVEVVNKLHANKKIMSLIKEIKKLQKILVNNKDKLVDEELQKLYDELNNYPLYQTYLIKKDELEEELKEIKNMFESYFKEVLEIN